MFSRKKKPEEKSKKNCGIPSIISSDMHVLGNIVSEGTVDVDGNVEGNVKCRAATIGKNGHVKGDVIAENVHVYGKVQGLIKACHVHFFKGCHVEGVIMHEAIIIEDGAFVDGRFKRTENIQLDEPENFKHPALEKPESGFPLKEEIETETPVTSILNGKDPLTTQKSAKKKTDDVHVLENLRLLSDAN